MRFGERINFFNSKIDTIKGNIINSVKRDGYNGVIFEMDGRLYTSVLAKLCKDAIGNHTKALIMPYEQISNHDDMCDAIDLASSFNIQYRVQDISHIIKAITLGYEIFNDDNLGRLMEIVKLACLYHEADRLNYAVVGLNTGNLEAIRYSYQILPLENLLPEYIEGIGALIGIPDNIVVK